MKEYKKSVESKISDLEDKKAAYIAEGNDLEALENQIEEEIRESQVGISEATETISSDSSEEETTTEQAVEEDSNDSDNSNNNSRSEEHTSELQSRFDLVCRLLLEKKKKKKKKIANDNN